jgi:two-component system cell cycle sensor histidine kinase/response regulator CckA
VLMNLCGNAKHAMRQTGGVMDIGLTEVLLDAEAVAGHPGTTAGDYLKLTVTDSGEGMPAEVLGKIFDPFFTTKGKDEGTGLGLSVVHGIVKSSGGFITVSSEPGKGSTFNVFWPVIEAQAIPPKEARESLPEGTERVLFVDDEKPLVDIYKQILERYGYEATVRTSSVEALELFKARPDRFDLVITDMTMPHINGLELAAAIIRLRPEIPVIVCTGFSESITQEGLRSIGVREFLMKPISKDDLLRKVRNVLDAEN